MDVDISAFSDTMLFAEKFATTLQRGDVVAFIGDLGSGKTTLISYIVKFLGGNIEDVSSPTFNYLNIYLVKNDIVVNHFDFYRLNKKDFWAMGFDEFIISSAISLIEWPFEGLPANTKFIHLSYNGRERRLSYEKSFTGVVL